MSTEPLHRASSDDGTEIAGHVHGQGPALVLVHGQTGDGDLDWVPLLAHLTDRFTCYLPSTRGRGHSAEHPDLSPERRVEDVTAFVDSIGEPVAYEPPAPEALGEEEAQRLEQPTEAMAQAVTEGRRSDAVRAFVGFVVNDDELAAFHAVNSVETTAKYAPTLQTERELEAQPGAFSPTNPTLLAQITAPALLLHGTRKRLTLQRPAR